MNPSDIAHKQFERIRGKGYRPEEVDLFLSQVAGELESLASEKRDLEQKLIVLADKLEEYKQDEDSLRSALIGAQKLGDSVVREAKAKAQQIEEDANARAALIVENAKKEIERQQQGYVRLQREVATFKAKLQLLYKQHLELISSIPADDSVIHAPAAPKEEPVPQPEAPAPVQPDPEPAPEPVPEPVDEYDIPLPVDDPLEYTEQPGSYSVEEYAAPEPKPEPEHRMRRESRFGPLKFGSNFDLKRDDKRKK
ncbi:MAG TPA: DivIVA domain-containing protein [Candidatus Anaerotruncus excrementipullorum]|uniref:DivIVA domain-containing protein n=1 Tax=Candidatus Anaerotruncus excrementipullorum TaxID=2838465 RepID=A0A9D1WQ65_9FIRM|nr:DivIVA domain-containing protein [Candidatus Anaerotruncus excrementipullorum]